MWVFGGRVWQTGNSACKGPEVGMSLAQWKNGKEASVAGVEGKWVRIVGYKI